MLGSLKKRLQRLERGASDADGILHFGNGSTAAIRVGDGVALLCAAMRRTSARLEGEPIPQSKHDNLLSAFSRAESVETGDNLLLAIHDVLR